METNRILQGDVLAVLRTLPDECVDCCVTSPPYWGLRDYGVEGQLGLEKTPEEFIANLVAVFHEVKRVLRKDGTLWLNIGDSYAANRAGGSQGKNGQRKDRRFTASTQPKMGVGLKSKDLVGIPWMLAFALRADGWYLRQDIIWHKPNPMPESVRDRCTKAHEYVFLLTKSPRYYYDHGAIAEPANFDGRKETMMKGSKKYSVGGWAENNKDHSAIGHNVAANRHVVPNKKEHTMASQGHERWRKDEMGNRIRNKRSVWTISPEPFKEAHFATFPKKLIEPMILAGTPPNGIVLDPFMGAGTTAIVALKHDRKYFGIELNQEYINMANERILKAHPNGKLPLSPIVPFTPASSGDRMRE